MPAPATVGDLIAAEDSAVADKAAKTSAAAAADKALADSTTAEASANAALGAEINKLGPDGVFDASGARVFLPSGNNAYHVINPKPATTPLA